MHQTDRVKLQLGFPQEITQQPTNMRDYHKLSLRKQVDTSWGIKWANEIANWNHRYERVLNGAMRFEVEVKPNYNFMSWFRATFAPFLLSTQQLQDPPWLKKNKKNRFFNCKHTATYPIEIVNLHHVALR
ncbi:hypothetical protein L195_g009176 [Trifolium pratense]|uniref:Uncharacterized protein n=1 Tax=Trifolium pratense TaxID=57577 RepID=A0A2K3PBB1_TRIPR|nr:hypothetical protein L195_g009176 [Trifolium pratense]